MHPPSFYPTLAVCSAVTTPRVLTVLDANFREITFIRLSISAFYISPVVFKRDPYDGFSKPEAPDGCFTTQWSISVTIYRWTLIFSHTHMLRIIIIKEPDFRGCFQTSTFIAVITVHNLTGNVVRSRVVPLEKNTFPLLVAEAVTPVRRGLIFKMIIIIIYYLLFS